MTGFDWGVLMRTGIRGLGLRPDDFWALTPGEFVLMSGFAGGVMPLSRSRLDELVAAHHDREKEQNDG